MWYIYRQNVIASVVTVLIDGCVCIGNDLLYAPILFNATIDI